MADTSLRASLLSDRIATAKRITDRLRPPAARPFSEMGVAGALVRGGYVFTRERSSDWTGQKRYQTISDMAVNCSVVAAGVHYFLNLIARPEWTVAPADDTSEAEEVAEFVDEVLHDADQPWNRIVRRAGTFRFYGFGIQEWTAKRRKDGKVGLRSVEARPQHTIERWSVARDGAVEGVWQRDPDSGREFGIPRSKMLYLVDDTLTDSPEGVGTFRHLAEPWSRLKGYYLLEERAFERDLRGIPIGRVPYTILNQMVADGELTDAQAAAIAKPIEDFVEVAIKQSDTGITLDSATYESQAADGRKVSSEQMFGLDLLQGSSNGMTEVGTSIKRTLHEMAMLLTTSHLLLGMEGTSGNRALAEDHSRNLYLIGNAVLGDVAAGVDADIVARVCSLNGIPEELWPSCEVEDVAFKDAESVASTLQKMAQAGAVLAPDDPVIEDVRSLMGVSPPTQLPPEISTIGDLGPELEEEGLEAGDEPPEDEVTKGEQPRVPAGSSEGGQFTSVGGGGGSALSISDHTSIREASGAGTLTANEVGSIREYTGQAHHDINYDLRHGGSGALHEPKPFSEVKLGGDEIVAEMDNVFNRTSLSKELVVERGVSSDFLQELKAKNGQSFTDSAFVSTSSGTEKLIFTNKVTVVLPKGARAIPIADIAQAGEAEMEVLVARGSTFKVSVQGDATTLTWVE